MKTKRSFLSAILTGGLLSGMMLMYSCSEGNDYADSVNPFIGTDYTGNTYPGAGCLTALCSSAPTTAFRGGTVLPAIFTPTALSPGSVTRI